MKASKNSNLTRLGSAIEIGILRFQKTIILISSFMIVAAMTLQIILRYIFRAPLLGTEEFSSLMSVWLFFIAFGYCSRENGHIKGEMVDYFFNSPRMKSIIAFIIAALNVVIVFIFGFYAVEYWLWTLSGMPISTALHFPLIFWDTGLLIGVLLITLYTLRDLVIAVHRLQHDFGGK